MATYQFGMVGLGVMGSNLAYNIADHGFAVAGLDLDEAKRQAFHEKAPAGKTIDAFDDAAAFAAALETPRRILMMVPAGPAVDSVIDSLLPHLEAGDILIDGGNTHFPDTVRRIEYVEGKGLRYLGMGVSGGEEGARRGPSLMPGGTRSSWEYVQEVLQSIAAVAEDGEPCCQFMGTGGAGHYVKMVHNGIEYGDMQMICEAYALMGRLLGMTPNEQSLVFQEWNAGDLDSYLIEITADILSKTDPDTGQPMVDVVLDTAGQKGTGKWTSVSGLDLGAPIPTVAEAVFARMLSAVKEERVAAAKVLAGPDLVFEGDRTAFIEDVRMALYCSKICSYAQGFQLLRYAAEEYGWELNYGSIAMVWREGCIVRARFLNRIKEAFDADPALVNLLTVPFFHDVIARGQESWRRVVAAAVTHGVPLPCMGSALSYYDAYRSERLPANLLQSQRDYFGAHTFERIDRPRGEMYHVDWPSL